MKHLVLLLMMILTLNLSGQNILQNGYYNLELPKETSYQKVNSIKEESSNIDLYKIINTNNRQTKYLIYLMSNKLNANIKGISDYNFKDYLQDIGKAEILSSKSINFKNEEFYKIKVGLDNNVKGLMYITAKEGTLYRLFFMLPNEEYYSKYLEEITSIFKSSSLL